MSNLGLQAFTFFEFGFLDLYTDHFEQYWGIQRGDRDPFFEEIARAVDSIQVPFVSASKSNEPHEKWYSIGCRKRCSNADAPTGNCHSARSFLELPAQKGGSSFPR